MVYKLSQLAPGSYDVMLNGVIIASLVRSSHTREPTWTAELLRDVPPEDRPVPCTGPEHTFPSSGEAQRWLGCAETHATGEED